MDDKTIEEMNELSNEIGYEVDILDYYDYIENKVTAEELKEIYKRESDK